MTEVLEVAQMAGRLILDISIVVLILKVAKLEREQ